MERSDNLVTRRLLGAASLMTALLGRELMAQPQADRHVQTAAALPPTSGELDVHLTVNGKARSLKLDPRTTLLDALRDHLGLTGTKKGCDHGQCGACTVLVNGVRMNACLSLAAQRDGDRIVTIEGLADEGLAGEGLAGAGAMAEVQAAFVKHDAFQCGYCTPGQICSAVGMAEELRRGYPSAATADLRADPVASAEEIRERMSGNICRCAAYPNIVAAITAASAGEP